MGICNPYRYKFPLSARDPIGEFKAGIVELSVISAFSFYLVLTIVELSLKSGHLPPPEPFSYAILEKI